MTKNSLKNLVEIFRTFAHYQCQVQGMMADNLDADTRGEDIPHDGNAFKALSHSYHNKFEKILRELEREQIIQELESKNDDSK